MALEIRHTDKVGAVLLVALSAGVFLVSRDFPSGFGETPGAAFFPRVIAATIGLLAVVLFVRSATSGEGRPHEISVENAKQFVVPVALLVAYVALMSYLGFVLVTVGFLILLMRYSGVRAYRRSVPLAVGIGVILHYVFGEFLHVPLPEGSVVSLSRFLPSLFVGVG